MNRSILAMTAALGVALAAPVFAQDVGDLTIPNFGAEEVTVPPPPQDAPADGCPGCTTADAGVPLNTLDGGQAPEPSYGPIDSTESISAGNNKRQCAVLAHILQQQATNEELQEILRNRGCY